MKLLLERVLKAVVVPSKVLRQFRYLQITAMSIRLNQHQKLQRLKFLIMGYMMLNVIMGGQGETFMIIAIREILVAQRVKVQLTALKQATQRLISQV